MISVTGKIGRKYKEIDCTKFVDDLLNKKKDKNEMSPILELEEQYLTTTQAAEDLLITQATVIQWFKKGWIKNVITTLGGHRRIPMSEVRRIRGEMSEPREANK